MNLQAGQYGGLVKTACWAVLIWAFCFVRMPAQDFQVRHYTEKDGLTSRAVRCIFKDSGGLLWIGTDAALCTFDGTDFRVVKTPDGQTLEKIWAIDEDPQGNLWFGSKVDGIYRFDGHSFERFTTSNGLSDNQVRYLYYSKKFNLVAACTYQGVNIIRGDSIIRSPDWMGTPTLTNTITKAADGKDFIYFTSIGWLSPIRYFPEKNEFVRANDIGTYYPGAALCVYISSKGDTLFSAYPKGLMIITPHGLIRDASIGQVFNVDEDKRGNLWMASWSYKNRDLKEGVFRFDGERFENFKDALGIKDKSIWTVFCDKEQDINWIGTENEGLFWFRSSDISQTKPEKMGLDELQINQLYVDSKDNLWISDNRELLCMSQDGLIAKMDRSRMMIAFQEYWKESRRNVYGQIDSVHKALRTLPKVKFAEFQNKFPFEFGKVIEDSDGTIYFSNRFGLFSWKDKKIDYHGPIGSEGTFKFMSRDTMVFAGWGGAVINPHFRDKSANIARNGQVTNTIEGSGLIEFNKEGSPHNINRIISHNDRLWYASWSEGLWMSHGMRLVHFNESDSTIDNNIADIGFDKQGHLIFGSGKAEIRIADIKGDSLRIIRKIGAADGLKGSTLNWIRIGPDNHLWAGTNLGLNSIDLNTLYESGDLKIRFYDEEGGYDGQGSLKTAMDSRGRLFVAGENSLIRIYTPSLLADKKTPWKVLIRSISVNGQDIRGSELNKLREGMLVNDLVRIKSLRSELVFNFDLFNYVNSGKDRYRYRLDGYEDYWSDWSKAKEARYTNLPHGRYKLIVEAYNQSTLIYAEPLVIEFFIPRHFWQIWYVLALGFLVWVTLISFLVAKYVDRRRLNQIRKVEMKRRILELEMQSLQNQMNPHFIYNCLNGIQHSILEQNTEEALGYLTDFSKVMRISLENASKTFIPLAKEIEFLKSYLHLEQMRFPDLFKFHIKDLTGSSGGSVQIPAMVIQPFAENSIRHGFARLKRIGILSIEFEWFDPETVKCTISDNGRGRSLAAKSHAHSDERVHSTAITESRIQLFNDQGTPGKYKVVYTDLFDNDKPCGLRVELIIPVK